jgi:hypothetical protein
MSAEDRLRDLQEAVEAVLWWRDAYPTSVFKEPDLERARYVLGEAGISMDALHGAWGRHIAQGICNGLGEALSRSRGLPRSPE